MRSTKLGAVVASLALTAGTAAVLAAGPAQAQTDTPTQSALTLGGRVGVAAPYGTSLGTWSAGVSDGVNPVTVGSADLQRKLPGQDWKTARTDSDISDGISFGSYGTKAKGNAKYRMHYLGGTDSGTATTYADSYSNTVNVKTAWNLHDQGICAPRCKIYGKLAPKARHHKMVVQALHHGTWKRYDVIHTNRRSHWTAFVKPTRGRGTKYRVVVAGTKHLIKSYSTIYRVYIISRSPARSLSPR